MTEPTPRHNPIATDQPQPSEAEARERVKAHVKATLMRLKARLRQSP